jgi:hypothetical protein
MSNLTRVLEGSEQDEYIKNRFPNWDRDAEKFKKKANELIAKGEQWQDNKD